MNRDSRMFTLVELMIVIAIIAVIAAVAIPLFHDFQLRSRRAEIPLIMDGLATALRTACAASGIDQAGAGVPCGNPNATELAPWQPNASPGKSARASGPMSAYGEVFTPDGLIRGSYATLDGAGPPDDMVVHSFGPGPCPAGLLCQNADMGCVFACSDMDGDGVDLTTEVIVERNILRAAVADP